MSEKANITRSESQKSETDSNMRCRRRNRRQEEEGQATVVRVSPFPSCLSSFPLKSDRERRATEKRYNSNCSSHRSLRPSSEFSLYDIHALSQQQLLLLLRERQTTVRPLACILASECVHSHLKQAPTRVSRSSLRHVADGDARLCLCLCVCCVVETHMLAVAS